MQSRRRIRPQTILLRWRKSRLARSSQARVQIRELDPDCLSRPTPRKNADSQWTSSNVYYGDQNFFPVYEPDPEVIARRAATLAAAAAAPLVDHYDATRENRTKGAGFYQFSGNEEERQAQMDALAKEREETERKRKERDEVGDAVKRKRESEVEERKRKIEAKRREMEEKRKRLKSGSDGAGGGT